MGQKPNESETMKKTYQNTKKQVAPKNDTEKPIRVITAEFSIEVTGEDEPTKYEKRRERWAITALLLFIIWVVSSIIFFFCLDDFSLWIMVISLVGFGISCSNAMDFTHDPSGHTPWWYGGL